ncbi:hypothetical protein GCM10022261_23340 [Brevibacterium daeguense]|uniref:YbdD/YjiX family protein n=1 Tax=Brevibacterium daeguense TaxID=909936 RepID=A0ABP8ELH6_9MICO|nr:YbdD/YjiX family protein [Brevibacterium daeguense]
MSAAVARLAAPFRAVHWYLKELMGENAYQHYLASYERRHGTREGAMAERAFWRDVTDAQDRNPQTRCC